LLSKRQDNLKEEILFRGIFLIVFLSSVTISGYHRKRARQSGEVIPRSAEGSTILLLRLVPALIMAVSFFAYVFAPGWLGWAEWRLPVIMRIGAAAVAIACLPAIQWMFVSLGNNITETVLTKGNHQLVTHGPYRWIRHPLYAFALLELFALAFLGSNWFLFIFPCVAIIMFRFVVIPKEEANLIKIFGKQYEEYQQNTGVLIPRFW
jgi:protein-S-isoprenylcysteine O-methyltransferase Ste14